MNEKKVCPLLARRNGMPDKEAKCIEDRCAWWGGKYNLCLIAVASLSLYSIDREGIEVFRT